MASSGKLKARGRVPAPPEPESDGEEERVARLEEERRPKPPAKRLWCSDSEDGGYSTDACSVGSDVKVKTRNCRRLDRAAKRRRCRDEAQAAGTKLKILSLNAMCSTEDIAQPEAAVRSWDKTRLHDPQSWSYRFCLFVEAIKGAEADILCFQELFPAQLRALMAVLPRRYFIIGSDEVSRHNCLPIIFDDEKFAMIACDYVEGSWVTCETGFLWAIFEDRPTQCRFEIINWQNEYAWAPPPNADAKTMAELTRMDPERPGMVLNGPIARKRSLQKLVAMIAEHESSLWKFDGSTELSRLQVTARTPPILIACDTDAYSRPEHAEVFRELRKFGFYDLHENEPLNIKSFHNFGGMKRVVRPHYIGRYDYILASPAIKRLSSRTIRERVRVQSKGGPPELRDYVREGYPSDHWPLIAEVEIGGRLAKM